jgi:hypothetical protein
MKEKLIKIKFSRIHRYEAWAPPETHKGQNKKLQL